MIGVSSHLIFASNTLSFLVPPVSAFRPVGIPPENAFGIPPASLASPGVRLGAPVLIQQQLLLQLLLLRIHFSSIP